MVEVAAGELASQAVVVVVIVADEPVAEVVAGVVANELLAMVVDDASLGSIGEKLLGEMVVEYDKLTVFSL